MEKQIPRTMVGGVSLPRILIGTNWFCGYSHRSSAADSMIKEKFIDNPNSPLCSIIETYLNYGVDAIMGLTLNNPHLLDGIKYAKDTLNKELILIDTPSMNVDDNKVARKEAEDVIKLSKKNGAKFCLIHHSSAEQLVNKNLSKMPRIEDYLDMIRQNDMIPGLSAHMPELIVYSDLNDYDVETYIQIYNPMGFLMQVEIEYIAKVINEAKKPVMTIKPFAAGRCTPYVGLNFVLNTIRECDMVTMGVMDSKEAVEDIEIAFAALERRYPDLTGRSSPAKQAAFG